MCYHFNIERKPSGGSGPRGLLTRIHFWGRNMKIAKLMLVLSFMLGFASSAAAQGSTILSVQSADGIKVDFDLARLEALEPFTFVTHTIWTDGPQRFTGVRPITLFAAAGVAPGAAIKATALNDYEVELPWSDIQDYPVIIAYRHDGEYMTVRENGPLWVIYPQDDYPELRGRGIESKMIWQLRSLQVLQ